MADMTVETLPGEGGVFIDGKLVRRDIRTGEKDGRTWVSHTLHILAGIVSHRVDVFNPSDDVKAYKLGQQVQLPIRVSVERGYLRMALDS